MFFGFFAIHPSCCRLLRGAGEHWAMRRLIAERVGKASLAKVATLMAEGGSFTPRNPSNCGDGLLAAVDHNPALIANQVEVDRHDHPPPLAALSLSRERIVYRLIQARGCCAQIGHLGSIKSNGNPDRSIERRDHFIDHVLRNLQHPFSPFGVCI
jgi:hypothetical protein